MTASTNGSLAEISEMNFAIPTDQAALENIILERIAADNTEDDSIFRLQLSKARQSRDMTGVGFFLNFALAEETPRLKKRRLWAKGWFYANGLVHPGGYLLWVSDDGLLETLEGYCVEDWPKEKIEFRSFVDQNAEEIK